MNRVHVIGRKNHGKTTLVVELVRHLRAEGLQIATIKHTHHHHELDTPGKDSHRHRMAGADAVGIVSQSSSAIFWDEAEDRPDRYQRFEDFFAVFDLVIVEGDTQATAPKLEVWRAAIGTTPMIESDRSIHGVITDDPLTDLLVARSCPHVARSDIRAVAALVQSLIAGK